jgi:hypothetical protein
VASKRKIHEAQKSEGSNSSPSKAAPKLASVPERKSKLSDLINVVIETANAKGWNASVSAKDTKNYRYATVSVSRRPTDTYQEVTGTFEITCDQRTKITYHSTSFHSWGLADLYDAIANEFWKLPWIKREEKTVTKSTSDLALLERLLRRFHRTARQLKHRHKDRAAFSIQDEYDVQDLLHAILRGLFDDVRPEEYTPSYAGGASRMDFLLKSEQIVLEIKFASPSLQDKQIGEQLIVDIKRYQSHPDCRRLICFVYDPLGNLKNPAGLETDLSGIHEKLEVKVIVVSP